MKEFAPATENNKEPILAILKTLLVDPLTVLEIGSGTGQHAVFFAEALPHVTWQTSDLTENHASIVAWIAESGLGNVREPLNLNVNAPSWPVEKAEAVFTANTFHIMSWATVKNALRGIGKILLPGGIFCVYGPFNYQGKYTSESNAAFDAHLRQMNPQQGIRDFEALEQVAAQNALALAQDHEMPANNRLLVWQRKAVGESWA